MEEDEETAADPTRSLADLPLTEGGFIPGDEIEEQASRSGGPGGQHVNTSATRVTLRWRLRDTRGLPAEARVRAEARLRRRLTRDGELIVHASSHRSRQRNREQARERLREIVDEALRRAPPRKPTRPTRGSRERRLETKRQRGALKSRRGRRPEPED
ncbi:MAG TPA: alternative ribosome rescue aminoacyl-tRNA hydrolase ArfB [Myxococcota bacterium]|nr:alternative ribosome rescue aminoacyl-tRNA hydrolase ArfB [Myxococcota bacterium]